ncbi:MAG: glycosyltransferase family 4 protein [Planctomycetota bacterium]|jgi:glycosyltransferase involved in cell wall biosynthesis
MSANEKIRVMLAGPYPHPGGMTGTYGRILNNLRTSPILAKKIELIPLRITLPADGNLIKRFMIDMVRFARSIRQKPDILHFIMQKYRSLYREYPILNIAKALGVKTIVDIRAGSLQNKLSRKGHKLQNAIMRDILRHGDAIALECKKDVPFIREHLGLEGIYIPNAVLEKDFRSTKSATLMLKKNQPLILIYSGRYWPEKGVDVMLKSLEILSKRGIKVELHLTGQGEDPELLKMINNFTEKPPEGTLVVDHGWNVPDLYGLLASAHVFVMPTYHPGEGYPNSVIEAMMAGLGMILSDWFHREDIVPEGGAIIIPPRDPAALADAVQRYINDSVLLVEAGQANRKFVEENYLDTVCYQRFLDLYKKLVYNNSN